MNREEMLEELSKYKVLPGHGPELDKLTDEKIEFQLKLYESMFGEYFDDEEKTCNKIATKLQRNRNKS